MKRVSNDLLRACSSDSINLGMATHTALKAMAHEIMAYREGFDPMEHLPEVGQIVRVTTTEGYRLAVLTSDRKWRWNCDAHPFESVNRWYPAIGGYDER